MTSRLIISTTLLLHFSVCSAQLQPMDDGDLEAVSGQLGIVFDGLKLVADPDANLQLSFDTDISLAAAALDHVSITGSGGCDPWAGTVTLGGCTGFSVGTASDPINFNVLTEGNTTYMELAMPGGVTGPSEAGSGGNFSFDYSGWTTGIDVSTRLVVYGQGYDKNGDETLQAGEQNLIFADTVWLQAKNIRLPGTSLKVWSNNTNLETDALLNVDGSGGLGASFALTVNGTIDELKMDFANSRGYNTATGASSAFASSSASSSTNDGPRSGSGFTGADGSVEGLISIGDIKVANLSLGHFPYLPLHFGSTTGDVDGPGFFVEIPLLTATQSVDYYANVPKGDVSIGTFELGGTGSTPYNVGSAEITGIRVQHLRIELGG